jgi:hypothetical protein
MRFFPAQKAPDRLAVPGLRLCASAVLFPSASAAGGRRLRFLGAVWLWRRFAQPFLAGPPRALR